MYLPLHFHLHLSLFSFSFASLLFCLSLSLLCLFSFSLLSSLYTQKRILTSQMIPPNGATLDVKFMCVSCVWCLVCCVLCVCVCVGSGVPVVCTFDPVPRVHIQNVHMCVPATRPHVWTFCQYTRRRFECTHGVGFIKENTRRVITCPRGSPNNHWMLPISSLRISSTLNP